MPSVKNAAEEVEEFHSATQRSQAQSRLDLLARQLHKGRRRPPQRQKPLGTPHDTTEVLSQTSTPQKEATPQVGSNRWTIALRATGEV